MGRFVKCKGGEANLELFGGLDGCKDCDNLIGDFCKLYHKIKCLELELLCKLENLGNIMKLADRVPSRVNTLRQCFQNIAEKNGEESSDVSQVSQDGLKKLKSFRTEIMNKCTKKN